MLPQFDRILSGIRRLFTDVIRTGPGVVVYDPCRGKNGETSPSRNHSCVGRCVNPTTASHRPLYVDGKRGDCKNCRNNDALPNGTKNRDATGEIRVGLGLVVIAKSLGDCGFRLTLRRHAGSRTTTVRIGVIGPPKEPRARRLAVALLHR
jgi:hypothetical protein